MDTLYLSSTHDASGRSAVVEETEGCIYLYLTRPHSGHLVKDCWLANTAAFESLPELDHFRSRSLPPPAGPEFVGDGALVESPLDRAWSLRWNQDGSAIAVELNGQPIGMIAADPPAARALHVAKLGPWGAPWDQTHFERLFPTDG